MKEENDRLKKELEKVRENFQTSLSSISHELRNSLTLILGTLQFIEQDYPEITNTDHWKNLHSDLTHMQMFLHDLSSLNSVSAPRLSCRLFDLNVFLHELTSVCSTWFDGVHKHLILSCPDSSSPLILYGDSGKLHQAFLNLIKNGWESLSAEGTVSLLLKTGPAQSFVIEIKDTGCGFPRKQQQEILRPFYTSKASGTGLGLPIARSIIEAHGGKLLISSEPGKGSVFSAILPRFPGTMK